MILTCEAGEGDRAKRGGGGAGAGILRERESEDQRARRHQVGAETDRDRAQGKQSVQGKSYRHHRRLLQLDDDLRSAELAVPALSVRRDGAERSVVGVSSF